MKRLLIISMTLAFSFTLGSELYSQNLLKKIKNKVEDKTVDKAVDKVFGKDADKNKTTTNTNDDTNNNNMGAANTSSRARPTQNSEGGGLSKTNTDVKGSINEAKTAVAAKKYPDARYSVRQAIQAVELEIGQNILKSLPDKANDLPKLPEEDKVTSNGIGFQGLFITRVYSAKDKELSIEILNDATMLMGINMYLNNPGMGGDNENNGKRIKYKDYPGLLQFDKSSGYALSVPFGQTSLFVVKGVNFKDEAEFMASANLFDLEKIKTELGEK